MFDFDGTLVDSKKNWYGSILTILKNEGVYCPECETKLIIHFGKRVKDVLELLDLHDKDIKNIQKKIYKRFLKNKTKLITNLEFLKNIDCKKIVLSNSPDFVIKKVLKNNKRYFEDIYGGDEIKDKIDFIKKLMKKNKLEKEEVWYIADRAGDVVTAKKAGCISVAVTNKYSWNSREEILSESPDIIIENIKKIKKII